MPPRKHIASAIPDRLMEAIKVVFLENDVLDAAVRAGVRRGVKSSIYGAEIGSPVPFRD